MHGTHGRRVPVGFGFLLGVVRSREGAGEVVGRGVGVARPVGWSPPHGRHGGMATGAVLPGVDDERRLEGILCRSKVREWIRGVERSSVVQGIEEKQHESDDLIRRSSDLGKNRVVPTTCSIKFPNQI